MGDGFGPLALLARQLAQHVLSVRIRRINLDLLLQFLLRLLGNLRTRVRLGEQQSRHTEMDPGDARVLFQHTAVFLRRLVPLSLQFESLGI